MNYSPDEFEALHEEVEAQGGALLPDVCSPQDIIFTSPPYPKHKVDKAITCGCGFLSIFVNEYTGEGNKPGFVRACAVCDSIGAWPRFEDTIREVREAAE